MNAQFYYHRVPAHLLWMFLFVVMYGRMSQGVGNFVTIFGIHVRVQLIVQFNRF